MSNALHHEWLDGLKGPGVVSVVVTIVFRAILVAQARDPPSDKLTLNKGINAIQEVNLGLSLITNIIATSIMAAWAWYEQ